jgi:pyrimidine operon attenuation protein/uracil phosphoribosyltransferase
MERNIILTSVQINHKIRRIAYQIYETFVDQDEIVIAGISKNGYIFAEKIADALGEVSPIKPILCEVFIDKKRPTNAVSTSITADQYKGKGLVLVDDVLHSGTTLAYGMRHFLDVPLVKFKTAILVDRNHKKYPIKADFKGISLSTSLKEHVTVEFYDNGGLAYLS